MRHRVVVEQRRQRGGDAVAARQVGHHLDARHSEAGVEELVHDLEHPALLAEHRAQRLQLGVGRPTARHRVHGRVDVDEACREPHGPGVETFAQHVAHACHLVGGCRPAGVVAEHEQAKHRVTDERRNVGGDVLADRLDHPAKTLAPTPVHPGVEGCLGHLLDEAEHRAEVLALRRSNRGEAERAVTGDHARHAVLDGGEQVGVEAHLRVVVRVGVDEAR